MEAIGEREYIGSTANSDHFLQIYKEKLDIEGTFRNVSRLVIVLHDALLDKVYDVGEEHSEDKLSKGIRGRHGWTSGRDRRRDTSHDAHRMGLAGEAAWIEACSSNAMDKVDWETRPRGRKGPDAFEHGCSQQVKTRDKPGYDFALSHAKKDGMLGDVGVLCWKVKSGTEKESYREIIVAGVISKKDFEANAEIFNFGEGERAGIKAWNMPTTRTI